MPDEFQRLAHQPRSRTGSSRLTFDEQIDAILATIPRRHRVPFLAGIRFAQGAIEHGDSLFRKTPDELARDEREEHADAYTYRHMRRKLK
jgi:hypothetical protein